MSRNCEISGHDHKLLNWICTNTKCNQNRFACSKCLISLHHDCMKNILEIEDLKKKDISCNINWIQDPDIKDAINFIKQYDLVTTDDVIEKFEQTMNQKFESLIQLFLEKVQEAKVRMVNNAKKLFSTPEADLEIFKNQIANLYDFDGLLEIIDYFENEQNDIDMINGELNDFLDRISADTRQQKDLQKLARNINWMNEGLLKNELKVFETFSNNLSFKIFEEYAVTKSKPWSWNPDKKSSCFGLSDGNMTARLLKTLPNSSPAVIGTEIFSKGRHQWEIELITGYEDSFWISFGIIEPHLIPVMVKNFDKFPYNSSMRLSSQGGASLLEGVCTLESYDNKAFLCDLDLSEGTFVILCEGKIVAKQQHSLKGKKFVPFVAACAVNNTVKLQVLKDV